MNTHNKILKFIIWPTQAPKTSINCLNIPGIWYDVRKTAQIHAIINEKKNQNRAARLKVRSVICATRDIIEFTRRKPTWRSNDSLCVHF